MTKQNHSINKELPIHKNVINRLTQSLADELYKKLISKKTDLSNRPFYSKANLSNLGEQKGGDQADQVNRIQEENRYTGRLQRDLFLLEQVMKALERMERGIYGICEETLEDIEPKRLLSLPWTTLSVEGAEIEETDRQNIRQIR